MKKTHMPPSLGEAWIFPEWDIENDFFDGPPWGYRNFWYTDIDGEGKYLVFDWTNCFDERDCPTICGHIYRFKELQKASAFCKSLYGEGLGHQDWGGGCFVLDCTDTLPMRVPWTICGEKTTIRPFLNRWRE